MYNIESLHYASNTRLHLAKYLYFKHCSSRTSVSHPSANGVLLNNGDRCVYDLRSVRERRPDSN